MNIYIASACQPNPTLDLPGSKPLWGACGWSVLVTKPDGEMLSAKTYGAEYSTLDVSELQALISALYVAARQEEHCTIYSTSKKVVKTIIEYCPSWSEKGWLSKLVLLREALDMYNRTRAKVIYVQEEEILNKFAKKLAADALTEVVSISST